jgi:hypothetical protein
MLRNRPAGGRRLSLRGSLRGPALNQIPRARAIPRLADLVAVIAGA